MRINKWLAQQTSLSRRTVDELITQKKILVNNSIATLGQEITGDESITIEGKPLQPQSFIPITILLHKPIGYVCSRDGQGSKTVYELLPKQYEALNIAGRLDKDSSGLVILSNDGEIIQEFSHPTLQKEKIYIITTQQPLTKNIMDNIQQKGINIGDQRLSKFKITPIEDKIDTYKIILYEGRNRQIRRTMEAIHNRVTSLHRIQIGGYHLKNIKEGQYIVVKST
jgi:pseudouridine synthase